MYQIHKQTKKLFKHLFIPHKANAFRPHALRHKPLAIYSAFLILLQLFLGATLYAGPATFAGNTQVSPQNILIFSNNERQRSSLAALSESKTLDDAAKLKLNDMFSKNYWDHTGPNGETAWGFMEQSGYRYLLAGENLARGFSNSASAVEAWMDSPAHRANILNGRFREMGVAIGTGKMGGNLTTVIVQLFGEPRTIFAARGVEGQKVLGEKKIIPEVSFENATVPSKVPYFVAWLLIFGLIILDGVMIRRLKLHTSKAHIFNFRIALVCSGAALAMLSLGFSAIA